MVRGSINNSNEEEKIFRQNPRKDINAIKKTEKKTDSIISKYRKHIWEDSNNRNNKNHQGTHSR